MVQTQSMNIDNVVVSHDTRQAMLIPGEKTLYFIPMTAELNKWIILLNC